MLGHVCKHEDASVCGLWCRKHTASDIKKNKPGSWDICRCYSTKETTVARSWRLIWSSTLCGSLTGESYLLFAAVDLPFLLCRQGKHGFPVFLCEVKLILQSGGKTEKKRVKKCYEGKRRSSKYYVFKMLYWWLHGQDSIHCRWSMVHI